MRLSLSVLLVTLALCCFNVIICSSLATHISAFLFTIDPVYKLQLQKYMAPSKAVEAKLQVKTCMNEISHGNKLLIAKILVILCPLCMIKDV
uniref:Uncharacterized protein n=1 Tax=Equus asinus asinus TaxID=83772 RepID=A0A8C4L2V7_EQUAS